MKHRLVMVLLMLLACSCQGSENNKAKPTPPPPDRSDTPQEAIGKGAPAVERPWLPPDYVAFDTYLSKLSKDAYPRIGSAKSKTLFAKLVDSAEQPILLRKDVPLNDRMGFALQLMGAGSDALKTYIAAHNAGTGYSTELVYLQGSLLTIARQALLLFDEFIPTLDPEDATYQTRMQGLRQVKDGMATIVNGAMLSMRETTVYSGAERLILAKYLASEAPAILAHLDKDVRRKIEVKLKELQAEETDKAVRGTLSVLLGKLEHQTPDNSVPTAK